MKASWTVEPQQPRRFARDPPALGSADLERGPYKLPFGSIDGRVLVEALVDQLLIPVLMILAALLLAVAPQAMAFA